VTKQNEAVNIREMKSFFDKLVPWSKKVEKQENFPLLCLSGASVETYADLNGRTARYAFIDVINQGSAAATGCWGTAISLNKQKETFSLHWTAIDCKKAPEAQKIDIPPGKHIRLEVAFALPPTSPEKAGESRGCWVAQPETLCSPAHDLKTFLPPGEYRFRLNVGCNQDIEVSTAVAKIISPEIWNKLSIQFI
jgi:hypothetical protein